MKTMGWQRHTVRGFMAGAMKKAGFTVESFKPEGGERRPTRTHSRGDGPRATGGGGGCRAIEPLGSGRAGLRAEAAGLRACRWRTL
jgi:hypothetical protein